MLSRSLLRAPRGILTRSNEFDTAGFTGRLTIAYQSRVDLATVPITLT
jgi:hypothetical protein